MSYIQGCFLNTYEYKLAMSEATIYVATLFDLLCI